MQHVPRLVPPGKAEGVAGLRSGAAPASLPQTPRKKGEYLDKLLRSLEDQYHLGLKTGSDWRSPARHNTIADKVNRKIQHLYFSYEPALDDAIATFANIASSITKDKRLEEFWKILLSKAEQSTPTSRTATPPTAKNVPPSQKTPQLRKYTSKRCTHR